MYIVQRLHREDGTKTPQTERQKRKRVKRQNERMTKGKYNVELVKRKVNGKMREHIHILLGKKTFMKCHRNRETEK